jgi:hypothetical protein
MPPQPPTRGPLPTAGGMLWWGKIPNVVHQQLVSSNGYAQLNSFASGTANVRAIGAGPTGLALANGTIAMAWNKPYAFNSVTTVSLIGADSSWLYHTTNSFGMGNDYFALVASNSFVMRGPVVGQFSLSQGMGLYSAVTVGQTQILGLLAGGTLMAADGGFLYQHPAVAGKRIISIASGANLSLAVDEDGNVHGWVSVLLGRTCHSCAQDSLRNTACLLATLLLATCLKSVAYQLPCAEAHTGQRLSAAKLPDLRRHCCGIKRHCRLRAGSQVDGGGGGLGGCQRTWTAQRATQHPGQGHRHCRWPDIRDGNPDRWQRDDLGQHQWLARAGAKAFVGNNRRPRHLRWPIVCHGHLR